MEEKEDDKIVPDTEREQEAYIPLPCNILLTSPPNKNIANTKEPISEYKIRVMQDLLLELNLHDGKRSSASHPC